MDESSSRKVNVKKVIKLVLFYILFILINMGLNRLCGLLHIPLFLDNVGTLLAAIWGGFLPGIIVGYLTNIINASASPETAFYSVISVLIALCAYFFASKGFFKKFWKALFTIPAFAFCGGFIGSILTYLIYGFGMGEGISAPFALKLLESGKVNVFFAQLISDVSIDIIDKAIVVIIVYIIIKIVPKKFVDSLEMTSWLQRPLEKEEIKETGKIEVPKIKLRTKIVVIIGAIMIMVALATSAISFILYHKFAVDQYTYTAKNVASLVASTIDADRVNDYLKEGGDKSQDYIDTKLRLERIIGSSPYIEYIYVYQILPDGCHVVFDIDTETLKGAECGEIVPFEDAFDDLIPQLLSGQQIEPIESNDTYGWLLSYYVPVYDNQHRCVCYACADINMKDVTVNGIRFLTKVTALFIGFFIFILGLCMWHMQYHLTYPINAMTYAARKFAYNSEEALETSVERLNSLDIKTGDEIESLYDSLSKTISDTVGYIEDVSQKGEQIANMQTGLIYILADLVESRDKCTGDHVKKTAAYVKLILELLKENNLYPDIVDDEYIKDVCNSAPLHDVGKIKVSDIILNKPARLTDEEFAEMKKHTTAGKEIIESAMKLTGGDSGYLKEALNLATYHHEKWDGTGYPVGMKGEEIPLSARIMAVSDVFDALVSTRSYKKPFSFEEAMNILTEGSGTHFDPIVADVFVANADRALVIAEEHKRTIG